MKFDCIIGNPPFNDETSSASGRRRGTEKLHLKFLNLSLNALKDGGEVALICPATGWWTGKNTSKAEYIRKGIRNAYRADKDGPAFDNAKIFNIGIFHGISGSPVATPVIDEFSSEKAEFSLKDAFKFVSHCGERITKEYKKKVFKRLEKEVGDYKVWMTIKEIGYTNDLSIFSDHTRGKWRVIFNHNNTIGKLGKVELASPEDILSESVSCFYVKNAAEGSRLKKFLETDKQVQEVFAEFKTSPTNAGHYFTKIDGSQFKKGAENE